MTKTIHTRFPSRELVNDPCVIYWGECQRNLPKIATKTLAGIHWRVNSHTAREIFTLRMLEHGVDKFAPDTGHGTILTQHGMDLIDA